MPDYGRYGSFNGVSICTGPGHVRLAISFASSRAQGKMTLTALPPVGACDHGEIDELRLRESVLEGIRSASNESGTLLQPAEVHYVANDTPRYDMFCRAAYLIARGVEEGIEFPDRPEWSGT